MEYKDEIEKRCTLKLRELKKELPDFVDEFFMSIAEITSIRTRVGYAYDLKIFFNYLMENCDAFKDVYINQIDCTHMNKIKAVDINRFLEYLSYYVKTNDDGEIVEITNRERGKSRKLSAVRRLFNYLYRVEKVSSNPGELIETPKIHDREIIRLEPNEVAVLLDEVEKGDNLTKRQKKWHEHTKIRDLAIVTLLLGTGMRVSECVGINICDVDFETNGVKIVRKGGKEAVVYFSDEVADALDAYFDEREEIIAKEGHEDALFLSLQKKRITDRAIQKLVKKYSECVINFKKISPHKLRSTYGTSLYMESGDIYLVADVLGHANVDTTTKHYAQMQDSRRRSAAKYVKLREK